MLRSFWFWLLVIVAAFILLMARDNLSALVPDFSLEAEGRTTNTKSIASVATRRPTSASGEEGVSSKTVRTVVPKTPGAGETPGAEETLGAVATRPTRTPIQPKVTSTPANTVAYTVKAGDTLFSIAQKYDAKVDDVAAQNQISDPASLFVGQELRIRLPATATPKPTNTKVPTLSVPARANAYTVEAGDTLTGIARKLGISVGDLQRLNNLNDPNALRVGMALIVPKSASSRTATPSASTTPGPSPSPTPVGGGIEGRAVRTTGNSAGTSTSSEGMPPPPQGTATLTPIPTATRMCPGGASVALVWGPTLCQPSGWGYAERGLPERAVYIYLDETTGDRGMMAIINPNGLPNAPLSWSMRQAKGALQAETAGNIPGGIAEPRIWNDVVATELAGEQAQLAEATTSYSATGNRARLKVAVFNHDGERWVVYMVAPENRWGYYTEVGFPMVLDSLRIQ